MNRNLPSLDSLRIFVAAVRHGSFSRAGVELGLTPSAVSQRMRALEAHIGVKLFKRHGPRLITTDRAKALAGGLEHALSLVHIAVDDCRRIKQPLRVTCAPTFAARGLVPRLGMYQALSGADAISLDAAQSLSPPGTFDVAIRSGTGPWPGYEAVRLLAEQGTPMISPKCVPPGAPFTLGMLLRTPLIPDPRWPQWLKLAGLPRARPKFVAARFPNYELEAQAAVKGIGAALLSPVLFADLLAERTLVAPFRWVVEGPSSYWLLCTRESSASHFGRWIRSQFGMLGEAR